MELIREHIGQRVALVINTGQCHIGRVSEDSNKRLFVDVPDRFSVAVGDFSYYSIKAYPLIEDAEWLGMEKGELNVRS